MLELIKTYYSYNSWATEQLLNALHQLNEEEYNAPGCSGRGSIRDTLAHCMSAQRGWFSWFDKSLSPMRSMAYRMTGDEIKTFDQAREMWLTVDTQTNNCIQKLTEENLNEIWSSEIPRRGALALPLWKFLLHVANHGTHTRGQIISAIRRYGHEPGVYEFVWFASKQ